VVKEAHLRLRLAMDGRDEPLKAVAFRCKQAPPIGSSIAVRYYLGVDDFGGRETLCLYVAEWSAVSPGP